MNEFLNFLKTRSKKQWFLFSIWVMLVALSVSLDIRDGKIEVAIFEAIALFIAFSFMAWAGYRSSAR